MRPLAAHEHKFEPVELVVANPFTGVRYKTLARQCSCGETQFSRLNAKLISQYRDEVAARRAAKPARRP